MKLEDTEESVRKNSTSLNTKQLFYYRDFHKEVILIIN